MLSAVSYNIFRRPDISKRVLLRIRDAAPLRLYLFSDGPRNLIEKQLVERSRVQALELIDWDCELIINFLETNIGFERMWDYTFHEVFKKEDRIIILEEDILPDLTFFSFCDELLEFYKNDHSVYRIGGFNSLEEYPKNSSQSYFFSEVVSSWGMATWRRVYEQRRKDLSIIRDPYYSSILKKRFKYSGGGLYWYNHLKMIYERPELNIDSAEFWFLGLNENILFNSLAIIPKYNLIKNLGNSEGAENSDNERILTKRQRLQYATRTLKMEFPLIHPKYKIIDYEFYFRVKNSRKVNLISKSLDKIERAFRILIFKGKKEFYLKLITYISRLIKKLRFYTRL
jgi:hypothetical protein